MTDRPSSLAGLLLGCVAPPGVVEALLGDLNEEYSLRAHSPGAAGLWYWGQVVRSLPPLAWAGVTDRQWLSTWAIAAAAFALASVSEAAALDAAVRLLPLGPQEDLIHLAVGLVTLALGGHLANRFRPAAAIALAGLAALVAAGLMIKYGSTSPLWLQFAFLTLGPAAALAGGAVRPRLLRRLWRKPGASDGRK